MHPHEVLRATGLVESGVREISLLLTDNRTMVDGPRKRKVRSRSGEWVDADDESHSTHHTMNDEQSVTQKRKLSTTMGPRKRTASVDPFQLVSLRISETIPSFRVKLSRTALATMDIHAHLSTNEVMGLLGGHFLEDAGAEKSLDSSGRGVLHVSVAIPCNAVSTGIQVCMHVILIIVDEHIVRNGSCF